MSQDTITIRHIPLRVPCGYFPEERTLGVDFSVDVTLTHYLGAAGRSDDLGQTIDYGAVAKTVVATAQGERMLVERLAEDIAQALLTGFPLGRVTVAVTKLRPPVPHIQGGVTITITRQRP